MSFYVQQRGLNGGISIRDLLEEPHGVDAPSLIVAGQLGQEKASVDGQKVILEPQRPSANVPKKPSLVLDLGDQVTPASSTLVVDVGQQRCPF
ncbi:MAG TPA: hypothetical protein VIO35_07345, partial [Chloroflexota bacterium]